MLPSRVPSYTSGRQKRTVHAFSEIFKQRFLKKIRTPHAFIVLSSTLVHFGTLKTHGCTHSQKYLELRFLKITHTPHAFIVLSSTLVHFGTLKTHGCTHSQKYLVKVSKDNTHPARFYRFLEYPCTLRNAKNARLHAFSEIFKIKVSENKT